MSTPPESVQRLTITELQVDSFKRLLAAHVTPTPTGLVPVRGKNAQGKSSLIESMLEVLGVEKAALPITEGEHGGGVKARLSNGNPAEDLIVEEKLTRDSGGKAKRSLSITAANGSKIKGPAGVLKSLRGRFADPVAFLGMSAAEQVKTVLAVLGLDDDLAVMEVEAEGFYDRRRDLGREVDRSGKALAEIEAEVGMLPPAPAPGALDAAVGRLQVAKDHNAGLEAHAATCRATAARGTEASNRAVRLRAELVKLEAEIEEQRATWDASAAALKGSGPVILDPILEEIRALEEGMKGAGKLELLETTRIQHTDAQAAWQVAEDGLTTVREEIADLLDSARFPVEGMHYDAGAKVITIGGIPFQQASQAEKIKVAAAVAMAGNPAIRVLFAREGSLLDDDSRLQLAQLADASDFQLWLEVVDSNPEGAGVWIEDGQAYQGGA